MNITHATTTVSLELGSPGITLNAAPQGLRSWIITGTAFASGLIFLIRKGCSDGVRKRVIKRLDLLAPRVRYHSHFSENNVIFNTECPVCLCEISENKCIRILECGHALCSPCLEAWAVHCVKAHLNPSRFGVTRNGRVVSWTSGPRCPLCCTKINCVPKQDLKNAILTAIGYRGVAVSTFVAAHSRFNPSMFNNHTHTQTTQHQQPNVEESNNNNIILHEQQHDDETSVQILPIVENVDQSQNDDDNHGDNNNIINNSLSTQSNNTSVWDHTRYSQNNSNGSS